MKYQDGKSLCKAFEGLRLKAYWEGNAWTIGYGHTSASGLPRVFKGLTITATKADQIFDQDWAVAGAAVDKYVTVPLSQKQKDALTDFVFNLGAYQFKNSTLLRKLNAGDYGQVPHELLKWNHDNGKVIAGLTKRRQAEADLWRAGSPPANQKPLKKSRTMAGGGVVAAGGVAEVAHAVNEFSNQADNAQAHISTGTIFGIVLGVVILAAAIYVIYARWTDSRTPT